MPTPINRGVSESSKELASPHLSHTHFPRGQRPGIAVSEQVYDSTEPKTGALCVLASARALVSLVFTAAVIPTRHGRQDSESTTDSECGRKSEVAYAQGLRTTQLPDRQEHSPEEGASGKSQRAWSSTSGALPASCGTLSVDERAQQTTFFGLINRLPPHITGLNLICLIFPTLMIPI